MLIMSMLVVYSDTEMLQTVAAYFPSSSEGETYGPFTVKLLKSESTNPHIIVRDFVISFSGKVKYDFVLYCFSSSCCLLMCSSRVLSVIFVCHFLGFCKLHQNVWFCTEWAIKNRPPTCQLIMSSKSKVHLK